MIFRKLKVFVVIFCILAFLLKQISAVTQAATFSTNTGTTDIGTVTLFANTTQTNLNMSTYVYYSSTFTPGGGTTNLYVMLSITSINSNSDISKADFYVRVGVLYTNKFRLDYGIGSTMILTQLQIKYFAWSTPPTFKFLNGYVFNTGFFQTNTSEVKYSHLVNFTTWNGNLQYTSLTTPFQNNKLYTFMRALKINSTGGNMKNLQMIRSVKNSTFWNITIIKPPNILIYTLEFDLISWSDSYVSPYPRTIQWGGVINSTNTGYTLINSSIIAAPYMFIGLGFFQAINDSSTLNYQINGSQTSTSTTINIGTLNPTNASRIPVNTVESEYFFPLYFYCPISTYLQIETFICYSSCPSNNVLIPDGSCGLCAYECATCSVPKVYQQGPNCLTCPSGRVLSSGQCICTNSSVFDDGYSSTCRLCNSTFVGTLTCSFYISPNLTETDYQNLFAGNWSVTLIPYFTSITCDTSYYISNNLCKTCQQIFNYCLSCTNSSQCASCDSSQGAVKYTDGNCYLCNVSNCQTCNQNNYCASCDIGYNAVNGSCSASPCNTNCLCDGWVLPMVNGTCSTLCGDGIKQGTQQCDDGNTINHDGCSSTCQIENCSQNCSCSGYYFPLVNNTCSTVCGDGVKAGTQQCDDGNIVDHDGCSSTCTIEACSQNCSCSGYYFPLVNNSCQTICGDGIIAGTQQCDDGNTINHDGCSSTCQIESCSQNCSCSGYYLPLVNDTCSTVCGDGIVAGTEQCDDGNNVSNDGCSATCMIQNCNLNCNCGGWVLPKINGTCSTLCGDGFKQGSQQCDDGNTISYDGCSSSCQIQGCNVTCNCSGWVFPRVNGLCTTTCGDGIKAGSQQCDDGNTVNHDGCSSTCQIENCSQNCSCSGYYFPLVNNTCSTVCGDGVKAGTQECDDGNVQNNDGCSSNCQLQQKPSYMITNSSTTQTGIFTQQKTSQGSLVMFLMGLRIAGLQSLWVYQSFQLLLVSQSSPFQISDNIHGYSNPEEFPYRIPNLSGQLFDKFNYMFFAVLFVFGVAILMEVLGQMFQSKNIVSNLTQESSSPMTTSQGPMINSRKKNYRFEQDDEDGNDDFTVHYEKKSIATGKNDLLSETQAISQHLSQSMNNPENRLPLLVRLSRILLRQVMFDLLINVQPILISTVISLLINQGIQNLLNFPTLVTIGCVEMFTMGLQGYLAMSHSGNNSKSSSDKQFWGENKSLFKQKSYLLYWLLALAERFLISLMIGVKFKYYLYCIVCVKSFFTLFNGIKQFYKQKTQNVRSLIINILHLLLLATFTVDNQYLQSSGMNSKLPSNLILIVYTTLIAAIIAITSVFFLKDLWQKCISNNKNSVANISPQNQAVERIFYSRREIEDSGFKLKEKTNLPQSTIFDQLRSRNMNTKSHHQKNTHRSVYQQNNNQNYRSSYEEEQQNDDYYHPKRTFMHDQPYEPEYQNDDIIDQDPRIYNSTRYNNRRQNPLQQSKIRRRQRRQVKTARRQGRQNENKENMQYNERQSYDDYENYENNRSTYDNFNINYRQQPQQSRYRLGNNNTLIGSRIKRVRTQHNANTVRNNVTQSDQYINDFDYQNDIGEVRYR